MANIRWNENQKRAIEERGKNILVSAAAGSGKTAVLVERIKKMVIEERVPIVNMLILTFTNAAAAEMKSKIRGSLLKERGKLLAGDNAGQTESRERLAYLQEQITALSIAQISTFHAFGMNVIKRFFYLIDETEPAVSVLGEDRQVLLKEDALEELLEEELEAMRPDFRDFLDAYGSGKNYDAVKAILLETYSRIMALPHSFAWLDKQINRIETGDTAAFAAQFPEEFAAIDEQIIASEKDTVPVLRTIQRLTIALARRYAAKKREIHGMDFDDIEHFCLAILEKQEAADFYRKRYQAIFIDEYQDTNLMQETIIDRIKRSDNLFMVGDIKQSIYRFRLADPDIFAEKYRRYAEEEGTDKNSVRILLNENYRSQPLIIDMVNRIFSRLFPHYGDDEKLIAAARLEQHLSLENIRPELHIVNVNSNKVDIKESMPEGPGGEQDRVGDAVRDLTDREKEALYIAQLIQSNLGRPYYDAQEGKIKKLALRDIVILMRYTRTTAHQYSRILARAGIPVYVEDQDGYFDAIEVRVFLNLLRVLDNRRQDIPFISILHAEIGNFSAEELAAIRAFTRKGTFYDAFLRFIDKGPDDNLRARCVAFAARLKAWKELIRRLPLNEFIWRLLLDSGYYLVAAAMPDGRRRQANLRALITYAESFMENRQGTLESFLRYIELVRASRHIRTPEAGNARAQEDVVRMMTVHKSKGLEFPMVIVADLAHRFKNDTPGALRIHKDLGLGLRHFRYEDGKRIRTRSPFYDLIGEQIKNEESAEEMRVLYVALTRAKNFLYMTAATGETALFEECAAAGKEPKSKIAGYLRFLAPLSDGHYKIVPLPDASDEMTEENRNEPPDAESADEMDAIRQENMPEDEISAIDICASDDTAHAALKQEVRDILRATCPQPGEDVKPALRSKYAVSDLNRKQAEKESGRAKLYIPTVQDTFLQPEDASPDAAARGTIYHQIMEHLSFAAAMEKGLPYIMEVVESLAARHLFGTEALAFVQPEAIEAFFATDIGKRAAEAERRGVLFKETPFTLADEKDGEPILIQGIIDCFFKDKDDTAVLIDYKSNRVTAGKEGAEALQEIAARYAVQMRIYKKALLASDVRAVKESWLYLFDRRVFLPMD